MQRHDIPTYHQMLKLGLSLGVLHVLCAPALADSTLTEIIDLETELEAEEKVFDQTAARHSKRSQPILADGNRQIGEQAFVPPYFSGSRAPTTAKINRPVSAVKQPVIPNEHLSKNTALDDIQAVGAVYTEALEQTQSARAVDPLDLDLQDTELSIEESWFGLLSTVWIEDTIGDAAAEEVATAEIDTEVMTHVEGAVLSPSAEHTPTFTRVEKLERLRANIQPQQDETGEGLAQSFSEIEATGLEVIESVSVESVGIELETLELEGTDLEVTDLEVAESEVADGIEVSATSGGEGANPARLGRDLLSEVLENHGVEPENYPVLDDELGTLRMVRLRSRENEELGILRILQTAQAEPPPPPAPIAFLGGRLGFVDVDNVFRTPNRFSEEVYQAGLSLYLAPKLSENTSIYAIAETNVARYNNFSQVNYNEVQVQIGLRQKLLPRTFAQVGWRNQRLYSPGYREKLFGVQYLDALVSHRQILSPKTWVDGFYQMRLGFADPEEASRFRQTFTLSLNYGISRNLRTSLLYQLDFDDYTQIDRYDTYQQLLGIVSYNITPESRLSFFGGTRFGRSSEANINLDDTFYGAGLNVNVPLF